LHFKKDYPDAKIFKLEQNYRSTKNIVKAANLLIKKNTNQIEKDIWTDNVEGEKIIIQKTLSDNDEGKQVAEAIFSLKHQRQLKNNEIAILYRTNSQSRSFEEALRRMNIPYTIYGGISFYQRKEIKDLLAYLKLIVNPYEEESLKRIINYPLRGVGDTTVNKLVLHAKTENIKLWDALMQVEKYSDIQPKTKGVIADFVIMLQAFAAQLDTNPYELAENVAKTTGIMRELHNDKSVEGLSRYENLQELLNSIKEYVENDEIIGDESVDNEKSLGNFLQSITLLTDTDKKNEADDSVKLMTIHASKGLEYKAVFLVGLEEGLFPSQKSLYDRDDLEEERRLFYVAITRAEAFLTISFATSRYKYGTINMCQPSRFINEVPEDIVELRGMGTIANGVPNEPKGYQWKNPVAQTLKTINKFNSTPSNEDFVADPPSVFAAGDQVQHQIFGFGTIKQLEGVDDKKIATIEFNGIGEKKIMLKFAKLKKS
jgi:DNA helicase-2/ATP-dependent DNA helicase PcrA